MGTPQAELDGTASAVVVVRGHTHQCADFGLERRSSLCCSETQWLWGVCRIVLDCHWLRAH